MTNRISTKRALILSLLSMLLCVSMLIGSTYAWFTDTATTAVNTIQAGTLKVELWQGDKDEKLSAEALKWVANDGRAQDEIFWEPGCSYNLESFRIKNNGNLALKYKVIINGLVGDAELLEAIDFTVSVEGDALVAKDGTSTVSDAKSLNNFEGTLAAQAVTGKITITGHMKETAGNDYMDKKIEGISITVYAAQDTVEKDSKDNTYDEGAEYFIPESNTEVIKDVLSNGGKVALGTDVKSNSGMKMQGDTSVNLNEKTWTVGDNTKLVDGANLTVSGGAVRCETYAGYIDVRPGSTTDSVVTYTDVDFTATYNAGRGTIGSSTTYTDYVLKFTPEAGGHTTFVFKNCTFTNSAIQFSGLSGKDGTFDAVFENCTFTALTNSALIEVKSYLTDSNITIKNCTFNVTATSNFSIVDGNYGRAATVTFEGENFVNVVVATPTGADKAGTAEEIKIFSENLNVKVCSAKTVNGLDTVTVSGIAKK